MYTKRLHFLGFFTGLSISHESVALTFRIRNRPWTILFVVLRKLLQALRLVRSEATAVATSRPRGVPPDVAAVNWYHTIDLGGGVVTPGIFDHRPILHSYRLPDRMDGLRVLDVATWDGFWAFEFERRGAQEVVALDIGSRGEVDMTPAVRRELMASGGADVFREVTGKGFQVAHRRLGSRVNRRVVNLYEVSPELLGTFDVVHVGDVLLHLKNPLRALENILSVTRGYAIISEPFVAELDSLGTPNLLRYLSGKKDTTWWEFSLGVLRQMVVDAGFERAELLNTFPFGGLFSHAIIHAFPPRAEREESGAAAGIHESVAR